MATRTPQNIGLMRKTTALHALHVRFTCCYISVPSSAKQQREMIKNSALWRMLVQDDKHFILSPNFNIVHISFILANCRVFYILKE